MLCDNELKEQLGEYLKGMLLATKADLVREHLKKCPDCQSDLEQIQFLLPGLTELAEGHIPVERLVDYRLAAKTATPSKSDDWKRHDIEEHLELCDQCRSELQKLKLFEEERAVQPKKVAKRFTLFPSRRIWYAVAAAAALLLLLVPNLPLRSQGPMIAVLPFEYEGPPEKEFYADGIAGEISKSLENVSAVGVIAFSSTIQYKNTAKKPGHISEELGVNYLLTGSIRWDTAGKIAKLRVFPRLVRTENQAEIWTEPFEIVWGEICNLPGIIARKVVSALNIELLQPEYQALESCPTGNIEAYEYYLRGRQYADRWETRKAVSMLEKAVQLDPYFAAAFAQLALEYSFVYWNEDPTEEWLSKTKAAAQRALELQPDLLKARLVMGLWMAYMDDERAVKMFTLAKKDLPNNSEELAILGHMQTGYGNFNQGLDYLKKAVKLDPLSARISGELATAYILLREYKEAERELDRGISLTPDWPIFYIDKAEWVSLRGEGNIEKARKVLAQAAGKVDSVSLASTWATVEFFAGDYQKALAYLPSASSFLMKAKIYYAMNQHQLARLYFDSARTDLEPKAAAGKRPRDAYFHQGLGLAYAGLGRKEEAIREGKLALQLKPVAKDAIFGPDLVEGLAEIYVRAGEYDSAINQLEYLLSIPSWVSVHSLRIDPTWTPLHSHPRFQKLINERA